MRNSLDHGDGTGAGEEARHGATLGHDGVLTPVENFALSPLRECGMAACCCVISYINYVLGI